MTPSFALYRQRVRPNFAVTVCSLLVVLGTLLVACGSTSSTATNRASTLHVLSAPGQGNPDFFNPYFNTNQGSDFGSQGLLYESLYFTNQYDGSTQPWLASSYQYSSDLTQLTFHLRTDVKWNDNTSLTSADVTYTFNLMKQYPALDQTGVWSILKSVGAPDANTVVFTLVHPDSTGLFRVGDQVFIVPQHIWSKVQGDPTKYANDTNPVGTGPYTLTNHSSDLVTYDANPNYWGTKPQVKKIQIPSIKDNSTAITAMIKGQLDWMGTGWNPDYDSLYTDKDPAHNHTWFSASNTVMLYLNLSKAPFNNLLVRKAINAAIDRTQLPQGVAKYAGVANPTGVIVPLLSSWISSQYQSMAFDTGKDKVASYMQQAGFKKGSDGFYQDASGKTFTMAIDVVNGWSDFDQDVQFMVNDLTQAGIKASVSMQSDYAPLYKAISTGDYDAAIYGTNSGPTPYYPFQALLSSANSAPAGQAVVGTNFERWDKTTSNGFSAQTDALLAQYEAASDPNAQKQAIQGIEAIMVSQLPVLPLTVNVYWDEYSTKNWTGWPTAATPYDSGAPYNQPDAENVILHLKPAA